ncbi:hypothetical protein M407DRAFT_97788 [Tulasnella calospora MUT 4182]|uniref:Cryptic loci regulator 2 N-terminal domain-containing protein n=1 Tax=Tulasnella calospora MUT 4182 TaxID=1051891 RepID=A0A0C3Q6B7_9AGAM|nr:hypothetical protein M407DRAFT_97788 [Tulasnella calospora MUT 4182]
MIHFTRTDGDPAHRPTTQQRDSCVVNGDVNFMRTVGVNEPAAALWRKKVGTALAKDLGLDQGKVWYLSGWPVDYELFVHAKGPVNAPRLDLYLYGGPSKFRSANEFYPHARWLLTAPSLETTKCVCKYCGNVKYQRQINFREGLGPPVASSPPNDRSSASQGPIASGSGTKTRPRRAPVAGVSSPQQQVEDNRFHPVNTYLESDLRSRRSFRLGEIVWVHLDPSIESFSSGRRIEWWPAVIQEPRFKTELAPRTPGEPYDVRQSQVYRVLMLGTTSQYVIPDGSILPYQAYTLPYDFLHEITQAVCSTPLKQELDFDRVLSFTPLPLPLRTAPGTIKGHQALSANPPLPLTYLDALLPYLAAIYTARLVSTYWCATDNYEFVSIPAHDVPVLIKQTRFQGLWWGGERLWIGDLVRIKPNRSHLAGNLRDPSQGAEKRGLLLRLEAIYLDEFKREVEGEVVETEWKPMVSGTLFEVAHAGFVESEVPSPGGSNSPGRPGDPINTPLPAPPPGFQFRAITPGADFDVHFELCMLAGRYYPNLLSSSLMASAVQITTVTPYTPPPNASNSRMALVPNYPPGLLSLVALEAGAVNAIDAVHWKEGRTQMLTCARQEMIALLQRQQAGGSSSSVPHTPTRTPLHTNTAMTTPAIASGSQTNGVASVADADGDVAMKTTLPTGALNPKGNGASHVLSTDVVEARVKQEIFDRLFLADSPEGRSAEGAIIID